MATCEGRHLQQAEVAAASSTGSVLSASRHRRRRRQARHACAGCEDELLCPHSCSCQKTQRLMNSRSTEQLGSCRRSLPRMMRAARGSQRAGSRAGLASQTVRREGGIPGTDLLKPRDRSTPGSCGTGNGLDPGSSGGSAQSRMGKNGSRLAPVSAHARARKT